MTDSADILLILITLIFPPAAVAILTGCSCDLMINLLLTLFGYIPGHIHAFWLIYKKMKAEERYGGAIKYHGNGEWQPLQAAPGQVQTVYHAPPAYGSTQ